MKLKIFFLLIVLSFLFSCTSLPKSQKIIKYTSEDNQYWELMVTKSKDEKISILDSIKMSHSSLYNQIIKDANDTILHTFWGQSLNFDSGVKKQIVSDQINADLHMAFGLSNDNKIVHAGVTHTYGYLFSVIDTPYGYKRKRWIEPALNNAFSLKGQSLSPETENGGLLSNITYFTGMLAFKNKSDRLALRKLKNVSDEIKKIKYDSLTILHLEEELIDFTLRTTLIKFPIKATISENDFLLVYSILNHQLNKEFLITSFPITNNAYLKILSPDNLGDNRSVLIRYNAYLEGLMDQNLNGKRRLWSEK
jgi:hypothetical protein